MRFVNVVSKRYYSGMKTPSSEFLADLLVHVSRQVAHGPASGLSGAQWSALRFFAHANRFSRQPSAFASYHGTTRGTASQTVKSLVKLGYLEKHPSQSDGRSVTFNITEAGASVLESDPQKALVRALESLDPENKEVLHQTLAVLDASLKSGTAGAKQRFGNCTDCRYYEAGSSATGICHFQSNVALVAAEEVGQLCCRFSPRTE